MSTRWWRSESAKGQHGQTLILVALAMVVLLLFAGLAIDVGVWYGQRRNMQNAADAGALAGAWEICFGSPGNAEGAALDYAEANGADRTLSTVDIDDDGIVIVTARADANLYLSSLVLSDFTIPAVAAAQCGASNEGCGMWPIAFDLPAYLSTTLTGACNGPEAWDGGTYIASRTANSGADFHDSSQFILWAGDNQEWDPSQVAKHCRFMSQPKTGNPYKLSSVVAGSPMDPGNRGWVALRLMPGYAIPAGSQWADCNSAGNCGSSALNCWLEHGYIGSIAIGDCLATEDGNINNSLENYAVLREGDAVSIILYDHPGEGADCDASGNPATCGGNKTYHVAGIGCVRVEHVFDGKNCKPHCTNVAESDKFNSIFWERHVLGGPDSWDKEYTRKSMASGAVYNGITGTNEYGFGCVYDEIDDEWDCANNEPKTYTCPGPAGGIVVTKLCSCPPTDCVGTGGGGSNISRNAVSLIPVPEP